MRAIPYRTALATVVCFGALTPVAAAGVLAGFATADITPPAGLEMAGFPRSDKRVASAVHDPLMAHAAVLELNGKRIAIVSCDVIGVTRELTRSVRALVEAGTGIPGRQILVSATHTHSGPVMYPLIGAGAGDEEYLARLPLAIAQAVIAASKALRPVELSYAQVPVEGIGQNREYQGGPVDTALRVLKFTANGRVVGFLVHYSVHNVTLSEQMHEYSADLTGVGIARVLREYPGAVGIYLQGSCGDINPAGFVNGRSPEECLRLLEQLSERFAGYVRQALRESSPFEVERMDAAARSFSLPLVPPDRALVLSDMQLAAGLLKEPGLTPGARARLEFLEESSRALLDRYQRTPLAERETEIQVLRIQDLLILANPAEVFISLAGRICQMLPQNKVWVTGYANDIVGYVPTSDRYDVSQNKLDYAAYYVPLALGEFRFREDVGDVLVRGLVSLAREAR